MKDIKGHKGVVSDESSRDEDTLVFKNNVGYKGLNSIGYSFSNDLKSHIT